MSDSQVKWKALTQSLVYVLFNFLTRFAFVRDIQAEKSVSVCCYLTLILFCLDVLTGVFSVRVRFFGWFCFVSLCWFIDVCSVFKIKCKQRLKSSVIFNCTI